MSRAMLLFSAKLGSLSILAAAPVIANDNVAMDSVESSSEESTESASPFGIEVGMAPNKLELMSPKVGKRLPGKVVVRSPPKPHPAFGEYVIQFGPKSGVCVVRALGWLVADDGTGTQVREVFGRIASPLGHRYGRYIREDAIRPDSRLAADEEWVRAISAGDRVFFADWSRAEGARMPAGLDAIRLEVVAGQHPAITLTYVFDNLRACEREIREIQDDVL